MIPASQLLGSFPATKRDHLPRMPQSQCAFNTTCGSLDHDSLWEPPSGEQVFLGPIAKLSTNTRVPELRSEDSDYHQAPIFLPPSLLPFLLWKGLRKKERERAREGAKVFKHSIIVALTSCFSCRFQFCSEDLTDSGPVCSTQSKYSLTINH